MVIPPRLIALYQSLNPIHRVASIAMFLCSLALILTVTQSGCGNPSDDLELLTVKGSDTMVHLMSDWAEIFMAKHPNRIIAVTGGGSGTGIAALLNQHTDIAASSRPINEEEVGFAQKTGLTPKEHIVALDGLVVITHPSNPINKLTMAQVRDLFTGKTANWKDAGWTDKPVLVFSRESSSGTFIYFQEKVLEKHDFVDSARLLPSTAAIIESVAQTPISIGYIGLGYALKAKDKVKIIPIAPDTYAQPIEPSNENIESGKYPISRPLFLYTADKPSPSVQQFLDFCTSEDGKAIILDNGYIPFTPKTTLADGGTSSP